jgi:hypothetical protein
MGGSDVMKSDLGGRAAAHQALGVRVWVVKDGLPGGRRRHEKPVAAVARFETVQVPKQYLMFRQQGYWSTKYSVSRDSPVQNIQIAGIVQYKIFRQQGNSNTKYSIITKY